MVDAKNPLKSKLLLEFLLAIYLKLPLDDLRQSLWNKILFIILQIEHSYML